MIGTTLGSYSIQRELGRGGMGAVYVGVHALLGRQAAVKVLLPELSRNQDIVQRFFNEARAATAIRHPGIVEIYDFGWSPDGSAFIVMEFLEGEPLSARVQRLGRLPVGVALGIARQAAAALAAAHRAGIVHRDLKPDNIFLVPDAEVAGGERVKLLDFGIAKLAGETSPSMARTSTGAIMGTPLYMSPEQCKGAGHVDHRSDLYALGCVLFEMLCGRVPFPGEGAGEIIGAHLHLAPPLPSQHAPEVSGDVEQLVLRLLAKDPARRPQTADALAQELAQLVAAHGGAPAGSGAASAAMPTVLAGTGVGTATTLGASAGVRPTPVPAGGAATTRSGRAGRTGMVLGIGGGLAAAATAAVLFATGAIGGGQEETGTGTDSGTGTGTGTATERGIVGDIDRLLADARAAVANEDWDSAGRMGRAVLALDGDQVEAQTIVARAEREGPAKVQATTVAAAKTHGDAEAAVAAYEAIPADSIYKARLAPAMDELRDAYFAEVTPRMTALVDKQQCVEARALADEATRLWPAAAAALRASADRCKGASGATVGAVTTKPPTPKPPKPPKEKPPERPTPTTGPIERDPPAVTGSLDKAVVRRVISRLRSKVTYCYEKELRENPDLAGTVTAKFVIGPDGTVASSSARGVSPEVASCVAEVMKTAQFPAPQGGGAVTISYPFVFKPTAPGGAGY